MKVLLYWAARTALMVGVWVALWFLGWEHWSAVVAAAVIAWLISYAMFGPLYDAAARQMEKALSTKFEWMNEDQEAEDREAR